MPIDVPEVVERDWYGATLSINFEISVRYEIGRTDVRSAAGSSDNFVNHG